jgi:L-asparaginase
MVKFASTLCWATTQKNATFNLCSFDPVLRETLPSALSFVLWDLRKPVVLTGVQIPAGRIGSDARGNFCNAIQVATLSQAGVMLAFNGDIILWSHSHKMSESKLDAFEPINWGLHGEICIHILFSNNAKECHDQPLHFRPGFKSNVAVLMLFPGFPPRNDISAIENGYKGIILWAFGSGNISYIYLDAIKLAKENKIPVVVDTQCLEGATIMHLYDASWQALGTGVIQAYDMSTKCVITKLMWALKHVENYEEIWEIMHTNFTGEINKEGKLYGAKTCKE